MARVSIITASYNHGPYITRAIESVIHQTFSDWEYIIWDDGSRDETLAIARKYAISVPEKIRIFTHPQGQNFGQERTRNAAIEKSTGELICLLDSDDYFHERKLEWLVPAFENPNVGLAYGKTEIFVEPEGKTIASRFKHYPQGNVFADLLKENFIGAAAVLFRRSCLQGGFCFDASVRTCGEYPLWLNIAKNWKVYHHPQVVAWWRFHQKNLSYQLSLQAKQELVYVIEKLYVQEPESFVIARALATKKYDYACELFFSLHHPETRSQCWDILRGMGSSKIKLKALLLLLMASLGQRTSGQLSKIKRKLWEHRQSFHER